MPWQTAPSLIIIGGAFNVAYNGGGANAGYHGVATISAHHGLAPKNAYHGEGTNASYQEQSHQELNIEQQVQQQLEIAPCKMLQVNQMESYNKIAYPYETNAGYNGVATNSAHHGLAPNNASHGEGTNAPYHGEPSNAIDHHIPSVHGKKDFNSKISDKALVNNSEMKKHTQVVHEGKQPFKRGICEKSFFTKVKSTLVGPLKANFRNT